MPFIMIALSRRLEARIGGRAERPPLRKVRGSGIGGSVDHRLAQHAFITMRGINVLVRCVCRDCAPDHDAVLHLKAMLAPQV